MTGETDSFCAGPIMIISTTAYVADREVLDIPLQYNVVADLLDRHLVSGRADQVAVEYQGRTWTYGQIAEQTNRVGHALRTLGVSREQRVLLVVPDAPEFAAAYLGAMKIGAVAVPCNTFLGMTCRGSSDQASLENGAGRLVS